MSTPKHLRRSTLDPFSAKKRRVLTALADPTKADYSNRQLGRECGVDEATVRRWKKELGKTAPTKAQAKKSWVGQAKK